MSEVQSAGRPLPPQPPRPTLATGIGHAPAQPTIGGVKASVWSGQGQRGGGNRQPSPSPSAEDSGSSDGELSGDFAAFRSPAFQTHPMDGFSETLTIHAALSHLQGNSEAMTLSPPQISEFKSLLLRNFSQEADPHSREARLMGNALLATNTEATHVLYESLSQAAAHAPVHRDSAPQPPLTTIDGVGGQYWSAPEPVAHHIVERILTYLDDEPQAIELAARLRLIVAVHVSRISLADLFTEPRYALPWLEAVLAVEHDLHNEKEQDPTKVIATLAELMPGLRSLSKLTKTK